MVNEHFTYYRNWGNSMRTNHNMPCGTRKKFSRRHFQFIADLAVGGLETGGEVSNRTSSPVISSRKHSSGIAVGSPPSISIQTPTVQIPSWIIRILCVYRKNTTKKIKMTVGRSKKLEEFLYKSGSCTQILFSLSLKSFKLFN